MHCTDVDRFDRNRQYPADTASASNDRMDASMPKNVLAFIAALPFLCVTHTARAQSNDGASIQSPRLVRLAAAIEHGDRGASEEFWTAIAKDRAPLIEELADRPNDALYTFLWRADSSDASFTVRFASSFTQRNRGG